jgi:hypothetical protein
MDEKMGSGVFIKGKEARARQKNWWEKTWSKIGRG